jgi:hypothetical protein
MIAREVGSTGGAAPGTGPAARAPRRARRSWGSSTLVPISQTRPPKRPMGSRIVQGAGEQSERGQDGSHRDGQPEPCPRPGRQAQNEGGHADPGQQQREGHDEPGAAGGKAQLGQGPGQTRPGCSRDLRAGPADQAGQREGGGGQQTAGQRDDGTGRRDSQRPQPPVDGGGPDGQRNGGAGIARQTAGGVSGRQPRPRSAAPGTPARSLTIRTRLRSASPG